MVSVCHLILYAFAAIFGIVNFVFLQNTMQLVDDNCVLFPRKLEFHWVDLPPPEDNHQLDNAHDRVKNMTDPAQDPNETNATNQTAKKVKRETNDDEDNEPKIQHDENGTAITGEFLDIYK